MAAIERLLPLALSLVLASVAVADDRASAYLWVHHDDDGLTVIHPAAAASADVREGTTVAARYDADVISAATIDVRTHASVRGFEETRHGLDASVTQETSTRSTLSGGYGVSLSPDHDSHHGSLALRLEDAHRIHAVTVSAAVARDLVGRAHQEARVGGVWTGGGSVGYAVVLGPSAALSLSLAAERQQGTLENPYRLVFVTAQDGGSQVLRAPEEVPEVRLRLGGRATLRYALSSRAFVRATARLHGDDWGVLGGELGLGATLELGARARLSLDARGQLQRAASFYAGRYETLPDIPRLRTGDRELAAGALAAGRVRLEIQVAEWEGGQLWLDLRDEVTWWRYQDTPLLPERLGHTFGVGWVVSR